MTEIRLKQRFQNFERAFQFLKKAIEKESLNELEISGLIKGFEFTFELAWKLMKDDLELRGFSPKSPRETIKEGFSVGIIEDGHIWIAMLENRNLFSHTYDQAASDHAIHIIRASYFKELASLYEYYRTKSL